MPYAILKHRVHSMKTYTSEDATLDLRRLEGMAEEYEAYYVIDPDAAVRFNVIKEKISEIKVKVSEQM